VFVSHDDNENTFPSASIFDLYKWLHFTHR